MRWQERRCYDILEETTSGWLWMLEKRETEAALGYRQSGGRRRPLEAVVAKVSAPMAGDVREKGRGEEEVHDGGYARAERSEVFGGRRQRVIVRSISMCPAAVPTGTKKSLPQRNIEEERRQFAVVKAVFPPAPGGDRMKERRRKPPSEVVVAGGKRGGPLRFNIRWAARKTIGARIPAIDSSVHSSIPAPATSVDRRRTLLEERCTAPNQPTRNQKGPPSGLQRSATNSTNPCLPRPGPPSAKTLILLFLFLRMPSSKVGLSNCRKKPVLNQTDLSDVVDFHAILESVDLIDGIFRLDCPGFDRPVFCFRDRPGTNFRFFDSTSLTAIYGPISDLFAAVQNKKILVEAENTVLSLGDDKIHSGNYIFSESNANTSVEAQGSFKSVSASTLLRKLRWGTLGLQFNWSKVSDQLRLRITGDQGGNLNERQGNFHTANCWSRNYDFTLPHNKIPEKLCQLAKEMAVPAMPSGEEFQPEAAIVNYFGPSDMLGGHLDDMEADWSKPIVSISLGCKAIFLLGGTSREDVPVSMFLRSGDIVLMAGKARECFHGVPRIFTDDKHAEVSVLLSQFSGEDDCCITDYIKNSRININIRQVN
ncbi:hypothetical protein ZIOFF_071600 [Zingiber officinale]|uniref:Fe2OG dioxygenase domain-containing protein n=1 Tax=Zingiber officinale TaxID=94328 RepID=A0A8J5C9W3_ZINOF|nr:hypothetical protein ZIOFF_071600 [Zingiber officinale]